MSVTQDRPPTPGHGRHRAVVGRRRFLTFLIAAPTLTVATKLGVDGLAAPDAAAGPLDILLPPPTVPGDIIDIGDAVAIAQAPTMHLIVLEVTAQGRVRLESNRTEVGQGVTTAMAMIVAEELDVPVTHVDVTLSDARPEFLYNQLTGGSTSMRSLYEPLRNLAAAARARLLGAAGQQWSLPTSRLRIVNGVVQGPGGLAAELGSLTAAAASADPAVIAANPKPEAEHTVIGTPTGRIDALAAVTGRKVFTVDVPVPGAVPTMVRYPPTLGGTVRKVRNADEVRAMPGVVDVVEIDTGVAVAADTFGQAWTAKDALDVDWGPSSLAGMSDEDVFDRLRAARPPLGVPPLGTRTFEAEFTFHAVSHAPLETNSAVADVREDRAEVWAGLKVPILAQQKVARMLDLPDSAVTLHVMPAGGSFGRRLFDDPVLEAVQVSKAIGRPARVMWTRTDDMRRGRHRPHTVQHLRAGVAGNAVTTFDQHVMGVETDFKQGLGEILTHTVTTLPGGNPGFSQLAFRLTQTVPYQLGAVLQQLVEVQIPELPTASWRSVYSPMTRGTQEILLDEIAADLGEDPYEMRLRLLKSELHRTVLRRAATEGGWGKRLKPGFGRGIGFHEEHRSCTACVVEVDGRDPQDPRVTKAVIVADVGRPINPTGLAAQLEGGLIDAISTAFRAGLHLVDGLPLEGSYSQFHYARQKNSPPDVRVIVLPARADGRPGGAGELGITAPFAAVVNAYARATGTTPRSFPIVFPVDFEPFPR